MTFWNKTPEKGRRIPVWIPLLAVGVLFLLMGIYEQQLADIYRKAVMICLECIGIG